MADHLGYTPGAGASVATDDVSGNHFQRIKLDVGGDGLSVPIVHTESLVPVGVKQKSAAILWSGATSTSPIETWTVPEGATEVFIYIKHNGSDFGPLANLTLQESFDGTNFVDTRESNYRQNNQAAWSVPLSGINTIGLSTGYLVRMNVRGRSKIRFTHGGSLSAANTVTGTITWGFGGAPFEIFAPVGLTVTGDRSGNGQQSTAWLGVGANRRQTELYDTFGGDANYGACLQQDYAHRLQVYPYHLPGQSIQATTGAETGLTVRQIFAAQGGSIRSYINTLTWSNNSAVATEVEIRDGASTAIHTFFAKANDGGTVTFPVPLRGSANTIMNFINLTTGAAVKVSAVGFKSAA